MFLFPIVSTRFHLKSSPSQECKAKTKEVDEKVMILSIVQRGKTAIELNRIIELRPMD
jgi:hypothetical protein